MCPSSSCPAPSAAPEHDLLQRSAPVWPIAPLALALGLAALASSTTGCTVVRPEGAYAPVDLGLDLDPDPGPDPGTDPGSGDPSEGKASPVLPDLPQSDEDARFSSLVGSYLIKAEVRGTLRHDRLGDFSSEVHTMSLFHVYSSDGVLYGHERQCYLNHENDALPGNFNTLETFVAQSVPQETLPVRREIVVDALGDWHTLRAPAAVGWEHAYPAETSSDSDYSPRRPPISATDALVRSWDDESPGVTIRSTATYLGSPVTCQTWVAQRIDPIYAGTLSQPPLQDGTLQGNFQDGRVDPSHNESEVLGASRADCDDSEASSSTAGPVSGNYLTFHPLQADEQGFWNVADEPEPACPARAVFEAL